jgi:hypothetical protein
MTKTLLIVAAVILFIPNLLKINPFTEKAYNQLEDFDPNLRRLSSVDDLSTYIDSIAAHDHILPGSYEFVLEISRLIRKRFYHGYCHFSFNENWIAAASGKLLGHGLGTKVHPGTILTSSNAACSQQAIVMMALLREKHIPYRHLGFPHHYAVEAFIDNKWYFFDPNMEPTLSKEQRSADNWKYVGDNLKPYYSRWGQAQVDFIFGINEQPVKGAVNEVPAPNARLFQGTAGVLSKTIWCFPLMLLYLRSRSLFPFRSRKKAIAV